jgi:hypothetical protein
MNTIKKILLFEVNPYHSEIIPGIIKYLEDLQYTIEVFVQSALLKDNIFLYYPHDIHIQKYDFKNIREILSAESITNYDFVFFSSLEFTFHDTINNVIQYLGFIPKTKYGILGIYHTTSHIDLFQDYKLMMEGRFFCLSDFQIHNYNLSVLNPHYFGSIKNISQSYNSFPLNRDAGNSIISIGNAFDTDMLSDALWRMYREKKFVRITHYGGNTQAVLERAIRKIKGAFVFMLAPFSRRFLKKRLFRKFVVQKGKVSFETLFASLLNCKYILVLINPHAAEHKHYITYTTSGIKQIIFGFKKIPIIHEEVALKYGFDRTNSIMYNDETLFSVLSSLPENLDDMIDSLDTMQKKIYKLSLDNLKNAIARIVSFATY